MKHEGHPVEYFYVNNVPSRGSRYYKLQADVIVEQLLWMVGINRVGCVGLGEPVVCDISASMKQDFLAAFPDTTGCRSLRLSCVMYRGIARIRDHPRCRIASC